MDKDIEGLVVRYCHRVDRPYTTTASTLCWSNPELSAEGDTQDEALDNLKRLISEK